MRTKTLVVGTLTGIAVLGGVVWAWQEPARTDAAVVEEARAIDGVVDAQLWVSKDWLYGDSRSLRIVAARDAHLPGLVEEFVTHLRDEQPDWSASAVVEIEGTPVKFDLVAHLDDEWQAGNRSAVDAAARLAAMPEVSGSDAFVRRVDVRPAVGHLVADVVVARASNVTTWGRALEAAGGDGEKIAWKITAERGVSGAETVVSWADVPQERDLAVWEALDGALRDARDEGSGPVEWVQYDWTVPVGGGEGRRDVRVVVDGVEEVGPRGWEPLWERLSALEAATGEDISWDVGPR